MEAYAADGWRGASREKVKPVDEIKRAKAQASPPFLAAAPSSSLLSLAPAITGRCRRGLPAPSSCRRGCVGAPADLELTAACPPAHRSTSARTRSAIACATATKRVSLPCPARRCAALAWHASPISAACTAPMASCAKRRAQAAMPGRMHAPGLPNCTHAHTTPHHTTPHHTTPHHVPCRVQRATARSPTSFSTLTASWTWTTSSAPSVPAQSPQT